MNWTPIKPEAPPRGIVLLYHPAQTGRNPLGAHMRVGRYGEWPNRLATHWAPMPEPPK